MSCTIFPYIKHYSAASI